MSWRERFFGKEKPSITCNGGKKLNIHLEEVASNFNPSSGTTTTHTVTLDAMGNTYYGKGSSAEAAEESVLNNFTTKFCAKKCTLKIIGDQCIYNSNKEDQT